MIVLAGLTPAWQQILFFDRFEVGEVNRAREVHRNASGKVLNAAAAVRWIGGDGLAVAPVGGPPVEAFDRELDTLGIRRRWVRTEAPTRICTTILDRSSGTMTELVENGRPLTQEELDAFCRVYEEEAARADVAVLIGSLPENTPDTYYRELLRRTPCPAVLDFRGPGLLAALDLEPALVKPNRDELAQTLDRPLESDEELHRAMRELNDRGAGWVVVTQGAGPVWASSTDALYRIDPPPVAEVVNPLGCGDAMAATVAWAIQDGRDMIDAVRLGTAAACDNLRHVLPCRFEREEVFRLAQSVRAERIE